MFEKTFYATHPEMMDGASQQDLRDRYLVSGLFRDREIVLTYSHGERFIIGGAVPGTGVLDLPRHSEPPSAAGHPLLERRERVSDVTVAPAHGLTLVGVDYPPDAELAARAAVTRRLRVPGGA